MPQARFTRAMSLPLCLLVYLVAAAAAVIAACLVRWESPILRAALADAVATLVVFAFSVALDNSNMYDPCWSAADRQLRRFHAKRSASRNGAGKILGTGLWSVSRHPNYFGEVLFWWGVYLFGLAADPGWWWTGFGPACITALFLGVSVPMMDRRMLSRHPGYERVFASRSPLVPWPGRRVTRTARDKRRSSR